MTISSTKYEKLKDEHRLQSILEKFDLNGCPRISYDDRGAFTENQLKWLLRTGIPKNNKNKNAIEATELVIKLLKSQTLST